MVKYDIIMHINQLAPLRVERQFIVAHAAGKIIGGEGSDRDQNG
jgi:hypothetical protein